MRALIFVTAVAGTAVSMSAQAQQKPTAEAAGVVASAPGRGTIAEAVEVTASVQAIDKAKRLVTLKGPAGDVFVVHAGPEVKNFDRIQVGDLVAARYVQALTLQLKKGSGALREKVEGGDVASAKPGEAPAVVGGHKVTVIADVIAVDAKKQTVRLRGPERTVDLKVPNAEQFKLVKVGDQVEATFVEAMALSVEPAKK
jgi:hypothetical protein